MQVPFADSTSFVKPAAADSPNAKDTHLSVDGFRSIPLKARAVSPPLRFPSLVRQGVSLRRLTAHREGSVTTICDFMRFREIGERYVFHKLTARADVYPIT